MTPEQEAEMATDLTDKPAGKKAAVSAQLVVLAQEQASFIRGEDGRTYAIPREGPGLAQLLRGEGSFRRHLSAAFYRSTGQVANANALGDALLVLEAEAEDTDTQPVFQRLAPTARGVLIDLGRPDQQVVEATAVGWQVRPLQVGDPLLRRSRTMGVMPVPTSGGSLEPLWKVLNARPDDRPVLIGWLASAFLPNVAQPFVLLKGEQGTGKTTAARLMLSLLDPGAGQMTSAPRTDRDFGVAAQGRTVLGLDNLSSITPALSDAICRAVTGESIVNRALYTDDGLSILSYRIALIITAIDPGALRGDLAERMLPVQLEPLGRLRRSEQELLDSFEAAKPALFGAVLDEVAAVLRNWEQAQGQEPETGWPRMADFGRALAALDTENGTASLEAYTLTIADNERDVAAGHPLADAVLRLVKTGQWKGTATDLLNQLTADTVFTRDERRGWKTAQELSQTLNKLSRNLRQLGVTVATGGRSNGRRYIDISLTDPTQYVSLRRPPAWHPPAVRPPLASAPEGQDVPAPPEPSTTEGTGSLEGHPGPGQ